MRALIVYYSRCGENLVDGAVRSLRVGNTERLAGILQRITGADCFRLEPMEDYPADYCRCIDLARQDLCRKRRPALKAYPEHLERYDRVYLGYPNYWGTMPVAVFSFLEHCDLSGKRILPFCTHEGGGMGRSEQDLRAACPDADIAEGLAIRGSELNYELSAIEEWANEAESICER